MAIVGVASVKIKPDLGEFRKELKTGLEAIKAEFTVKVKADTDPARRTIEEFVAKQELKDINKKVDINKSSLQVAKKEMESLSANIKSAGRLFFSLAQSLTSASLGIIKVGVVSGAASAALLGITHAVAGLGHALAAVAPGAFAVGLGGLLTVVAAAATIKFGLAGIGRALDGLNAPVAKLRSEVEASFQSSFIPAVNNLKTVIPQLKTPLKEVATAIGGVATRFTAMLKTGQNVGLLKSIIESSSKSIQNLGKALAPLGHAFLEVGAVASKVFTSLTAGAGAAAQKFADKISAKADSGSLEASFKRSLAVTKELFQVIKNVGSGIKNIFGAITGTSARPFIDTLTDFSTAFKKFTGLDSTKQFFATLGQVVHILADGFLQLLAAIGPVLPLLADTAKVLAGGLADAVKSIAPLLAEVLTHLLGAVQEIIPKLLPFIGKLADAFLRIVDAVIPLLSPLADLIGSLTPLLDPIVKLVQNLVPPLVRLFKDLAPVIDILAKALGGLGIVLGPVVGGITGLAANGLAAITDLLGITHSEITKSGKTGNLADRFKKVGADSGKAFGDGLTEAGKTGVEGFNHGILSALGIKGNGISSLAQKLGIDAAANLANGFAEVTPQVAVALGAIHDLFGGHKPVFTTDGNDLMAAFGFGMSSQEKALHDIAQRAIDAILGIFRPAAPTAAQAGAAISKSLASGVSTEQSAVITAAQSVANAFPGIFGAVSLFGQGARIMSSLSAGAQSVVNAVRNVFAAVTLGIPQWKGPPEKDKVLLKPAGIAIMQGLIEGVVSQQSELERVLGTVTDQFTATNGTLGSSFTASSFISGDLSAMSPQVNVNLSTNDALFKDLVNVQISEGNRETRRNALTGGAVFQ